MRFWFVIAFLIGCGDGNKESDIPPLSSTDPEGSCGGTAPIIDALTCINSGTNYNEDEGLDLPTFTISLHATDEDKDLTGYTMQIKFDQIPDGELESDALELSVAGALQGELCGVPEADIGARISLHGGPPELSTTYEWHVTLFDAAGVRSEDAIIVCTTPDEDGNGDPNPQGWETEDTGQ
jgi:hypothetical protein